MADPRRFYYQVDVDGDGAPWEKRTYSHIAIDRTRPEIRHQVSASYYREYIPSAEFKLHCLLDFPTPSDAFRAKLAPIVGPLDHATLIALADHRGVPVPNELRHAPKHSAA